MDQKRVTERSSLNVLLLSANVGFQNSVSVEDHPFSTEPRISIAVQLSHSHPSQIDLKGMSMTSFTTRTAESVALHKVPTHVAVHLPQLTKGLCVVHSQLFQKFVAKGKELPRKIVSLQCVRVFIANQMRQPYTTYRRQKSHPEQSVLPFRKKDKPDGPLSAEIHIIGSLLSVLQAVRIICISCTAFFGTWPQKILLLPSRLYHPTTHELFSNMIFEYRLANFAARPLELVCLHNIPKVFGDLRTYIITRAEIVVWDPKVSFQYQMVVKKMVMRRRIVALYKTLLDFIGIPDASSDPLSSITVAIRDVSLGMHVADRQIHMLEDGPSHWGIVSDNFQFQAVSTWLRQQNNSLQGRDWAFWFGW